MTEDERVLQTAELRVIDAHDWGMNAVVPQLDAMKLFAIPALELACDENWMAMAKGAAAIALTGAEDLVASLRLVVDAIETAAATR